MKTAFIYLSKTSGTTNKIKIRLYGQVSKTS